ncbi:MAG TPA: CocE/NonD family hydrolase [Candidatus Saccharimonadales bacterium]|nr:CocE/NonD family hydrolase [Candidatus Saccharimonadales bacterium]
MDQSEPSYGIVIAKDVMVPMRDGVRLATDIYYPAREGAPAGGVFPAILGRTSYDKNSPQMWVAPVGEFFSRRGYVVVLQDLRGRHHSEGTGQYFHTANPSEGPDGYDTVEWIAAQPWSNGRVGTVGSSHGAIVQQVMALHRPPHLTAIWPDVGPTNIYAHEAREGGAMQLHMFGAQFLHAHDAQEIRDDPVGQRTIEAAMEELRDWVQRAPFKPGHLPLGVVPNLETTFFNYYYRGAYDEFWMQECCDQERYFDRHADVPGVYSGGWYDPFSVATTNYFAAMAKQNRTPQRLVMGPWNHGGIRGLGATYAGDVDFGRAALWGDDVYNAERLRWFDRWLKDIPTGVENAPPVRIFVMGGGSGRKTKEGRLDHGGHWRTEREWPLTRTRYVTFHLHAGGSLNPGLPDSDAPPARFLYDPAHPVPTIGGAVTGFYELVPVASDLNPLYLVPRARMRSIVLDGGAHQKEEPGIIGARPPYPPLAARPDVLVFQTAPLKHDVEVTGPIVVNLWISSSAVDTDFTAKLLDVYPASPDYPAGYHLNLVDSILRARYRESWEKEVFLTPGEIYPIRIALPPTSNRFAAGHRIRLDVSSSNFPRFDLNPNTGEPVGRHTFSIVARNAVYLDRIHPSHVILPIIPTESD